MILKKKIYFALLCAGSYWLHHLILPTWNMSSHPPDPSRKMVCFWIECTLRSGPIIECFLVYASLVSVLFSPSSLLPVFWHSSGVHPFPPRRRGSCPRRRGSCPPPPAFQGPIKGLNIDGLIWYFLLLGIVKATLFERYKDNLSIGAIIGKVIDK